MSYNNKLIKWGKHMLKLKYLDYDEELAIQGAKRWLTNTENVTKLFQYFRISSNAVYPFYYGERVCFLRIAPVEEKIKKNEFGEIEFINYLINHGYPALKPVKSLAGNYVEILNNESCAYFVSVFEEVEGDPIEEIELNDEILYAYGKSLGKLHELSSQYIATKKKWSYKDVLHWIHDELQCHEDKKYALAEYEAVKKELANLDKTSKNFGLVHFDFEIDNVFYDEKIGDCNVIDFEDSMYHWYGLDIEQALDSLADLVEGEEWEAAKKVFLEGYATEYKLSDAMVDHLPLFRRFIDLYSYTRILRSVEEVFEDEPDWLIEIRGKLDDKQKRIRAKWSC